MPSPSQSDRVLHLSDAVITHDPSSVYKYGRLKGRVMVRWPLPIHKARWCLNIHVSSMCSAHAPLTCMRRQLLPQ